MADNRKKLFDDGRREYVGLNDEQVIRSRADNGSNSFTEKKTQGFFRRLLSELGDPIIRILLCALVITLIIPGEGGNLDAIGIAVAVLLATLVSTVCEYGSENAFKRMQREARGQSCRAVRNGRRCELPVGELVVGDAVLLKAGELVPADGYLISGAVSCNLSALNGESAEQKKYAREASDGESTRREKGGAENVLGDKSSLFRGSELTAGEGTMLVTAVGDRTYYGKMAGELQCDGGDSPLKLKLKRLAETLSKVGYFCALLIGISDLLFNTVLDSTFALSWENLLHALAHALTLSVSVVVMAVPEGLPMMITVVLASNMLKMQKAHVMVRKLVGIETAGSINILFTDKTGTLTYGKPKVSSYVCSDAEAEKITELPKPLSELTGLLSFYAVGCEEGFENGNVRATGGDVTDRALMESAISCGARRAEGRRVAFFPFNSTDKLCAATVELSCGGERFARCGRQITLVKGAPEILLEYCDRAYGSDGEICSIDKSVLRARLDKLASAGVRVMVAASSASTPEAVRKHAARAAEGERASVAELMEQGVFICFICISDSLRSEARESVLQLQQAGIQTVMITGDNRLTAEAIAEQVGILPRGKRAAGAVFSGSEIEAMSDEELKRILPELRVVSRALPQDKSRLVRVAKEMGTVVGMTGDGLNDAPALKSAHVGFAMGSGTDVAKEAADIIITDNNIASVVNAVLYGRTIFRSIRKFIVFQLTMNLCAVGISIIGPFIGYDSPVTVIQMLWINIIIDTLAALAFAGEAPLAEYMREAPIPKDEPVLSFDMLTKIFVLGLYTLMLCVYFLVSPRIAQVFCASEGNGRILTGFFALFIFSGIIGSLNARTERVRLFGGLLENPMFVLVMCGVFTTQMLMIYYGGELFGTVPLNGRELINVLIPATTVVPVGRVFEAVKRIGTARRRGSASAVPMRYPSDR
ncbi:MAG: calcium-translocating P-type ATPase, PMCA-type [Clostridia bacterium]|nr:calcium-translocating P-type ATPase, PMCA-type [Clostridia bacterium]